MKIEDEQEPGAEASTEYGIMYLMRIGFLGMEPEPDFWAMPEAEHTEPPQASIEDYRQEIEEAVRGGWKEGELARIANKYNIHPEIFNERELRLIANCRAYAKNDPAGLPGHNLMIIIKKMARLLNIE